MLSCKTVSIEPLPSEEDLDAPLGGAELVVCALLEHMLRVADDNCHEVCEVDAPPAACASSLADILATDGASDQVVVVVGVAIYLTSSLFNNRCVSDPKRIGLCTMN